MQLTRKDFARDVRGQSQQIRIVRGTDHGAHERKDTLGSNQSRYAPSNGVTHVVDGERMQACSDEVFLNGFEG